MTAFRSINHKRTAVKMQKRSALGASLIELAAVAALMPLVTLVGVNIGVLVFAAGVNDAACKDAARAAGQRSTPEDAIAAAKAVVARYSSGFFAKPEVVSSDYQVYPDEDGEAQIDATHQPNVNIRVRSTVDVPAPIIFNGSQFTSRMVFDRTYSFPILNPSRPQNDTDFYETNPNQADNAANRIGKEISRSQKKLEKLEEKAALAEAKAIATANIAEESRLAAIPFDNAVTAALNAYNANPNDSTLKALKDAQNAARVPDSNRDRDADDAARALAKQEIADALVRAEEEHLAQLEHELEIAYNTEALLTEASADQAADDQDAGTGGSDDEEDDATDEIITAD
ncbi:MAG: hypothetical protein K2X27_13870 [Candidatus Obscuribacterales bacterium]|nr:hypothetical protein [Candidatus Obscuribacterales bacterium]